MKSMVANNLPEAEPAAIRIWVDRRVVMLELTDDRIFEFPANRFKLLRDATDEQLLLPLHSKNSYKKDIRRRLG